MLLEVITTAGYFTGLIKCKHLTYVLFVGTVGFLVTAWFFKNWVSTVIGHITALTTSCLNPVSHKWDVAKGTSTFIDSHLILCSQLAHGYVRRRDASSVLRRFAQDLRSHRSSFRITQCNRVCCPWG